MTLPSRKDTKLPILIEVEAMGGMVRYKELPPRVARHFSQITSADLEEKTTDGDNKWIERIQYAGWDLSREGLLKRSGGVWMITEKGLEQMKREGLKVAESPALSQLLSRHDDLKQKMVDIGKELGYGTSTEERIIFYQHDVLWKPGRRKDPSYIIEICAGGSLPKDFDALSQTPREFGAKGILVTVDDMDYHKALRRFENQSDIVVVKAEVIDILHELIRTDLEFLKSIFSV